MRVNSKNCQNNPHFKHIIYNMPSLTILQSSYTIFWSIGYIRYIKLPSLLPQSMRARAARAFTEQHYGAREKNEGNFILVLLFLDHFKHLETTQIISRTLSLIVCAIMRVINNDRRNFALKLSSKLPTFLLITLVSKVHFTIFFLRGCILSWLWLLSTKICLEKLNVAFLRVNNFIKYWKMIYYNCQ